MHSPRRGPTRVRLAPTPSGGLHLGGARLALAQQAFARSTGGALLLRIDDTDHHVAARHHEAALLAALAWLGIPLAVSLRQSERHDTYREAAERLIEQGDAYRCFCPVRAKETCACGALEPSQVAALRKARPSATRLRVRERSTSYDDAVLGRVCIDLPRDPVIVRSDGRGLFHLATVIDDLAMGITHVIRGTEHREGAGIQLALYRALGQAPPRFAHVPLLLGPDGKKLSKRRGSPTIFDLARQGYCASGVRAALTHTGGTRAWEDLSRARSVEAAEQALGRLGRRPSRVTPASLGEANRAALAGGADGADDAMAAGGQGGPAFVRGWAKRLGLSAHQPPDPLACDALARDLAARMGAPAVVSRLLVALLAPDLGVPEASRRAFAEPAARAALAHLRAHAPAHDERSAAPWLSSIARAAEATALPRAEVLGLVRVALLGRADGPAVSLLVEALGAREVRRRLRTALRRRASTAARRSGARASRARIAHSIASAFGLADATETAVHPSRRGEVYEVRDGVLGEAQAGASSAPSACASSVFVKLRRDRGATADFAVEAACMRLLADTGLAPTAPLLDLTQQTFPHPALSYRGVPGRTLAAADLAGGGWERVARCLARVHALNLPGSRDLPTRGLHSIAEAYRDLVVAYQHYLRLRVHLGIAETALTRAFTDAVIALGADAEEAAAACGAAPERRLCHGDVRYHNAIERPDGALALVDWETAYFGDPAQDLAWMLELGRANDRTAVDVIAAYREVRSLASDPAFERRVVALRRIAIVRWPIQLMTLAAEGALALGDRPDKARLAALRDEVVEIAWRLARALRSRGHRGLTAAQVWGADPIVQCPSPKHAPTHAPRFEYVVIDGEAGSLKSPVAALLAKALGMRHVSFGAYFRYATWLALHLDVALTDAGALAAALSSWPPRIEPRAEAPHLSCRTALVPAELAPALFAAQIEARVGQIARHPEIEARAASWVRSLGAGLVIEGRHVGRDLFPEARLRFFLTADESVRGARKHGQLGGLGEDLARADVQALVDARDALDFGEAGSNGARGAWVIDTTTMDTEQVAALLLEALDHAHPGQPRPGHTP